MTPSATTTTVRLDELHAGQRRILEGAGRYNVVACGRRFGKTTVAKELAFWPAADGYPVGYFVPEYKLLTEVWEDWTRTLAPLISDVDRQQKRIRLLTGGLIECWAFDRNPNAGRSRRYKRIIVDEAAHCRTLKALWQKCLRPTLTDFRGDAYFLSSPRGQDDFFELFKRGQSGAPGWRSWQMSSYDNPLLDRREIDAAREDLPTQVFGQEYLAEFLTDPTAVVIPPEWLDRSIAATPGRSGLVWMGIDPSGGVDRDRSTIVVRDDNAVLELWGSPTHGVFPEARERLEPIIVAMARKWGVPGARVVYDANGVGRPLGSYLEAAPYGLPGAQAFFGGESGGRRFANLRTACAFALRRRIDPTTPALPPFRLPGDSPHWPALREELEALRTRLETVERDVAKESLEPKEAMKARLGGRSPDFADALIMSFLFPEW